MSDRYRPLRDGAWRVFLSHTGELDRFPVQGGSYIQHAIDAVSKAGHVPVDMRIFPNRDQTPTDIDRERLESCDVYFGIFGFRWGSASTTDPSRSYTEEEYDLAKQLGIQRRIFLLDEASNGLAMSPEQLGFFEETLDQQRAFRERAKTRVVAQVKGPQHLATEIAQALDDLRSEGVSAVRGMTDPAMVHTDTGTQRTNIPPRGDRPFIGRAGVIDKMGEVLADTDCEQVILLHGPPGVGKTGLALEYARQTTADYPGGRFFVSWGSGAGLVDLARVGASQLGLDFVAGLGVVEQCEQTLAAIGSEPTLLIYDNPQSLDEISGWIPASGVACHVVVTSVNEQLLPRWPGFEVEPLTAEQSLEVVNAVAGAEPAAQVGSRLVEMAGGLPVQLLPASEALAYEHRRGRLAPALEMSLADEAQLSFTLAYETLDSSAKVVLHAVALLSIDRVEQVELLDQFRDALGWSDDQFNAAVDTCVDRHLLDGIDQLRMHRLIAEYLTGIDPNTSIQDELDAVCETQSRRLVETAAAVHDDPADRDKLARFLTYPPAVPNGDGFTAPDMQLVGSALVEVGNFDEARSWHERAVTEAEQGDVHGRINHQRLLSIKEALAALPDAE